MIFDLQSLILGQFGGCHVSYSLLHLVNSNSTYCDGMRCTIILLLLQHHVCIASCSTCDLGTRQPVNPSLTWLNSYAPAVSSSSASTPLGHARRLTQLTAEPLITCNQHPAPPSITSFFENTVQGQEKASQAQKRVFAFWDFE